MPQLDGLRALAVSGVMFQHFFGNYYLLPRLLEVGDLGVRLFFVLSGFLITGILLQCRDGLDGANTVGGAALRFYARRALRILPVFYVVLAVATLMDLDPVRESLAWHMAYLSNFYLAKQGFWDGCVSHLWSLAVEEQFYLIWPVVVLMTPRQWLARVIGAAIVVGILSPSAALLAGANPIAATVLPNSCLDTLGMGALLALFAHDPRYAGRRRRLVMLGRNLGAPLFLLMAALHAFGIAQEVYLVGRDMAVALLGVWVIDTAPAGAIRSSTGRCDCRRWCTSAGSATASTSSTCSSLTPLPRWRTGSAGSCRRRLCRGRRCTPPSRLCSPACHGTCSRSR